MVVEQVERSFEGLTHGRQLFETPPCKPLSVGGASGVYGVASAEVPVLGFLIRIYGLARLVREHCRLAKPEQERAAPRIGAIEQAQCC